MEVVIQQREELRSSEATGNWQKWEANATPDWRNNGRRWWHQSLEIKPPIRSWNQWDCIAG